MLSRLLLPFSRRNFSYFHVAKSYPVNLRFNIFQQQQLRYHIIKNNPTLTLTQAKISNINNCTKTTKKKSNPITDFIFDNLGSLFLSAIGLLIVTLIRSHLGTNNRMDLRSKIEELSPLDPFECDELRYNALSSSIYKKILETIKEYDWNEMTYGEFINIILNEIIPKRMKNGHYLDRVILNSYTSLVEKIPFDFLLVLLNMTLDCSPEERIQLLFEIYTPKILQGDINTSNITISKQKVIRLVDLLQQTSQLVPESQIIEDDTKYPIQKYRKATSKEMLRKAQEEVKLQELPEWTCQNVEIILRSKNICVWGECYQK